MTNDLSLRAKPGESLTLDEMRRSLPAIFAGQPHESRSHRYVYISTEDMLGRLMAADFLPVEARTSRSRDESRRPFTKHMLRLRGRGELLRPDNTVMRGDGVAFEVILRNACDGTSSYQMLAGLIRFACENGLVVSDGTVAQLKVLHAGSARRVMDQVVASATTVLEQGPKVADKIRTWRQIDLEREEGMVLAQAAHKARFGDEPTTLVQPEQLLVPRRQGDVGRDLWKVFNVVQENALRGGLTATVERNGSRGRRTLPIRGIDGDVALNRRLWDIADRMAHHKQTGIPFEAIGPGKMAVAS